MSTARLLRTKMTPLEMVSRAGPSYLFGVEPRIVLKRFQGHMRVNEFKEIEKMGKWEEPRH